MSDDLIERVEAGAQGIEHVKGRGVGAAVPEAQPTVRLTRDLATAGERLVELHDRARDRQGLSHGALLSHLPRLGGAQAVPKSSHGPWALTLRHRDPWRRAAP